MTKYISKANRVDASRLTPQQLDTMLHELPFKTLCHQLLGSLATQALTRYVTVRNTTLEDYTRNRSTVPHYYGKQHTRLGQLRWLVNYCLDLTTYVNTNAEDIEHLQQVIARLSVMYLQHFGAEPREPWPTLTESQWGCYLFGNYMWYSVIPNRNWFYLPRIQEFQQDYRTLTLLLTKLRRDLNSDLGITSPEEFNAVRKMYIALVKYQQARAMITVLEQLGVTRKYLEQDFHQLVVANPPYPLIPGEKLQLLVDHYSQALLEAIQVPDILDQYQRLLETVDFDINLSSYLE